MTGNVVTVLTVDARGAETGSATYVRAMRAAQAAVDRVLDSELKAQEAIGKGAAVMGGRADSIARVSRSWENLKRAIDPAFDSHQKIERAMLAADAAVKRLGVSEAEAARVLTAYRREIDGTAEAERRFKSELDRTLASLDGTTAAERRLAQQQAVLNQALKQGDISAAQYARAMGEAQRQAQGMATSTNVVAGTFRNMLTVGRQLFPILSGVFAVREAGRLVGDVAQAGSEWQLFSARAEQAGVKLLDVFEISQRTSTAINDNVKVVQRLGLATRDLGATSGDVLRVTETITKLGRAGGASTQELAAGTTQIAQALASGRLGGDELRSVLENLPPVARAIAEGLGVSVGRLREMGAAGLLTAERVFGALLKGGQKADEMFAKLPVTLEMAWQRSTNALFRLGAAIDNSTGLSRLLARGITAVADAAETAARRIEGDLVQRIKDLGAEVDRLERNRRAANPEETPRTAFDAGRPRPFPGPLFGPAPQTFQRGAQARGELDLLTRQAQFQIEAAAAAGGAMNERAIADAVAANKKMTDGLAELHKELGLVAVEGKLVADEQSKLERITLAVNAALAQGGTALELYGGKAGALTGFLERLQQKLDPLKGAIAELNRETALLVIPEGFERDVAARRQQIEQARGGQPLTDDELGDLRLSVLNRNTAQSANLAVETERSARAQQQLARAAGGSNAAMREAQRINAIVAEGYKVGLTPEQEKFIRSTGRIPSMSEGAASALKRVDDAFRLKGAAEAASETRQYGVAAAAAVRQADLLAEAAGQGEAAQRAAAAAAAVYAERNNGAAEALKQRAIEEAAVRSITNETTRTLERSAEASTAMAVAIYQGAEAVEIETRAQYQREQALRLGADRTEELARIMRAYDADRAAAKARAGADEAVQLERQSEATLRLADATREGSAAVAEAETQNKLLVAAQAKGLDTVEDLERAYPRLAAAIKGTAAAAEQLALAQTRAQQAREIQVGRAELALAEALPEIRARELTLLRAKLEIADKFPRATQDERDELLRNATVLADINDLLRVGNEIRSRAESIAGDVTDFLVDGFANVENAGKSVFENIYDGAIAGGRRFLIRLGGEFLKQQLILPVTLQLVGGLAPLLGIRPTAGNGLAGAGAGGISLQNLPGSSLFGGLGDTLGIDNLLGSGSGFLGLPDFGAALSTLFGGGAAIGSTTAAVASAAPAIGASGFLVGGVDAAATAAAGFGAAGAGIGASLASVALPIAAIAVPLILGGLFKRKPSNEGAEYSFFTDSAFTTQFEGTKHPARMDFVRGFAEPLQQLVESAERTYGIARRDDAVIGATFGKKEGSAFFLDRGPRDGGIENRQVFGFDPEDDASIQAALDAMLVAFLKDADWTGIGARLGEQAAADVATALENSAATTLSDLIADIDFAKAFQGFVDLAEIGFDPEKLGLRKIGQEVSATFAGIRSQVDAFRQRAEDLGLGAELLENGLTRAEAATQGFLIELLDLDGALDPVVAAQERYNRSVAEFRSLAEDAKLSAEVVDQVVQRMFDNIVVSAQQAAAATAIAYQIDSLNIRNTAVFGPNYRPPADQFLYGLVGYKYQDNLGPGGGTFAPLVQAIEGARAGSVAALDEVIRRAGLNVDRGVFTREESLSVQRFAAELFSTWQQRQVAQESPVSTPDGGTGTGGGGGGSDDSARRANDERIREMEKEIDVIRSSVDAREDELRAAERLAGSFRDAATDLRLYRLGLLTDPATSPLSLEQQLLEAQRQQQNAFERVLAGGPGAPEAARELQQANARVNELATLVFGSSKQRNDIFFAGIEMLRQAEEASLAFAAAEDQKAEAIRLELVKLNDQIGLLRGQIDGLRDTGSGAPPMTPPGGTGDGGVGSAPPSSVLPTFGIANLGRGANETADTFIRRMFPKVAETLGADGPISEQEGYDWAQGPHRSGLRMHDGRPLTNAAYYTAARRGGYLGAFTDDGHRGFLYSGDDPILPRWYKFIDELRSFGPVPKGFFGIDYNLGGLVGDGVPGRDSVRANLTPGEFVVREPIVRAVGLPALEALNSGRGWANDNLAVVRAIEAHADKMMHGFARLAARVAQLEEEVAEAAAEQRGTNNALRATVAGAKGAVAQPPKRMARG